MLLLLANFPLLQLEKTSRKGVTLQMIQIVRV
jgi:hypothetical protein